MSSIKAITQGGSKNENRSITKVFNKTVGTKHNEVTKELQVLSRNVIKTNIILNREKGMEEKLRYCDRKELIKINGQKGTRGPNKSQIYVNFQTAIYEILRAGKTITSISGGVELDTSLNLPSLLVENFSVTLAKAPTILMSTEDQTETHFNFTMMVKDIDHRIKCLMYYTKCGMMIQGKKEVINHLGNKTEAEYFVDILHEIVELLQKRIDVKVETEKYRKLFIEWKRLSTSPLKDIDEIESEIDPILEEDYTNEFEGSNDELMLDESENDMSADMSYNNYMKEIENLTENITVAESNNTEVGSTAIIGELATVLNEADNLESEIPVAAAEQQTALALTFHGAEPVEQSATESNIIKNLQSEIIVFNNKVNSISEIGKSYAKKWSENKIKLEDENKQLKDKLSEIQIQNRELLNSNKSFKKLEQDKILLEEKLNEIAKKLAEEKENSSVFKRTIKAMQELESIKDGKNKDSQEKSVEIGTIPKQKRETGTVPKKIKNSSHSKNNIIISDSDDEEDDEAFGNRMKEYYENRRENHVKNDIDLRDLNREIDNTQLDASFERQKMEIDNYIWKYFCEKCDYEATSTDLLKNHMKTTHENKVPEKTQNYHCYICEFTVDRRDHLKAHIQNQHTHKCDKCEFETTFTDALKMHKNSAHKPKRAYEGTNKKFCHFWNNKGYCKNESSCEYLHRESPFCRMQKECKQNLCEFYHEDFYNQNPQRRN